MKTLRANYLNIRDLLGYSKIVMPLAALDVVSSFLEQDMDDEWVDAEDAAVEGQDAALARYYPPAGSY